MTTLAAVLASLSNEDGSPDIGARRQQLNSLMSQLSKPELRHIRECLSALSWTMDFIPNLPVEVVICISDYLTLTDFAVTQLVSKSWNTCFTRSDIVNHLAKKHFRMAYETSFKTAAPVAHLTLFNALSCRAYAINRGNYRSMTYFSYNLLEPSESIRCSGQDRVAWTFNELIFLRNLVSGDIKRFVTPERHRVTGLCMRDNCLVVKCASSSLCAWSIANGEMQKIQLPAIPALFDTNHGDVFVTLRDGSVLKWAIGHGVRPLNIPILSKQSVFALGCDPLLKDTLIRCLVELVDTSINEMTLSALPKKMLRLVAEKFTGDRMISRSSIDLLLSEKGRIAFKTTSTGIKMAEHCNGFDENGCCNVLLSSELIKIENSACSHSKDDSYDYSYSCSFFRICYSAIEGRWRKDAYARPDKTILGALTGLAQINSIHFIENLALLPAISDKDMFHTTGNFLAVGIEPWNENGTQDLTTMKLRCISGLDGNSIVSRQLVAEPSQESLHQKAGLRYAWAAEEVPSALYLRTLLEAHWSGSLFRISGNSTFTVLFGPCGYIVWCYDKNIILSQPSNHDRGFLRSWPAIIYSQKGTM